MDEHIGPFCIVLGDDGKIILDYIAPIIYLTAAVLMIPIIFMFIRARIKEKLNIPTRVFCMTLSYFCIQLITCILFLIWVRSECHNGEISIILLPIAQFIFTTQMMILIGLWFYRLYATYRSVPALELRKHTIITFTIFYLVTWISYQVTSVLYGIYPVPGGIIETLYTYSVILVLILIITLVSLYIYKMYGVYRIDITDGQTLLIVIRKTALLTFVSVSATFLFFVVLQIGLQYYAETYPIAALIHMSDVYTNALCVFLSYKQFDEYYYRLCGFCDSKCIQKCVGNKHVKNVQEMRNSIQITAPKTKLDGVPSADSNSDIRKTVDVVIK